MSYGIVKKGIADILEGEKLTESTSVSNFEDSPSSEYDKSFILKAVSGENDPETTDTLADRFYDVQTWEVHIAFKRTSQSDVINRDEAHRKKDNLLKKLDNPSNWSSFVRLVKYETWEIQELENFFLLIITLKVTDTFIY